MSDFLHHLALCAPLFLLVFIGWSLGKTKVFDAVVGRAVSTFVFKLLMPVMLFHVLSTMSEMPAVDFRLLFAFFGSCCIVFFLGRAIGKRKFKQDSTGQVIMGMGGIFGNDVQLGIPIMQVSLGAQALPTFSLLIVANVLVLWTWATACVEFGRTQGRIDAKKFCLSLSRVLTNPIVLGIMFGLLIGVSGWRVPLVIDQCAGLIARATPPMALLAVGMGLSQHSIGASLRQAGSITALKLVVQPALVFVLCTLIGINEVQTKAAVLLASLPVAINLYIMATQFEAEEGTASNAIFVSTFISALTVPLTLTLLEMGA